MRIEYRVHRVRMHRQFYQSGVSADETASLFDRCPACTGDLLELVRLVDAKSRPVLVRSICGRCHLVVLARGPTRAWIDRYYREKWDHLPGNAAVHDRSTNDAPLRAFERHCPGASRAASRVLDIGAGYGMALRSFRDAGFTRLFAVEQSARRAAHVSGTLGIPTATCGIEDLPGSALLERDGPFEFVYLWHVFEHLVDPARALAVLATAVAPGGLLMLAVPNFFRESTIHLGHDVHHVCSYTAASLCRLVADAGFERLELDERAACSGFVLVARRGAGASAPIPPAPTRRDVIAKVARDLDLYYGYAEWNAGRPFCHRLSLDELQNGRVVDQSFAPRRRQRIARWLTGGAPGYSIDLSFAQYDPNVHEYLHRCTAVAFDPSTPDPEVLAIDLRYDAPSVPIWLK